MRRFPALALLALPLVAADWEIDPAHSTAMFSVRHMMVSTLRGQFGKLTGTVKWDEKNPLAASVKAEVETASVNTHEPKRDEDLRGPEFFDAAKYPAITFQSTKVQRAGAGKLKLTGNLSIRGVTRQVVFDVEGPTAAVKSPTGPRAGAVATTKVNRREFGLLYNKLLESGGLVVSDEVTLTIDIEMVQRTAPAAP